MPSEVCAKHPNKAEELEGFWNAYVKIRVKGAEISDGE